MVSSLRSADPVLRATHRATPRNAIRDDAQYAALRATDLATFADFSDTWGATRGRTGWATRAATRAATERATIDATFTATFAAVKEGLK